MTHYRLWLIKGIIVFREIRTFSVLVFRMTEFQITRIYVPLIDVTIFRMFPFTECSPLPNVRIFRMSRSEWLIFYFLFLRHNLWVITNVSASQLKLGASSRWSLGPRTPSAACGGIETVTVGKTHPSLLDIEFNDLNLRSPKWLQNQFEPRL